MLALETAVNRGAFVEHDLSRRGVNELLSIVYSPAQSVCHADLVLLPLHALIDHPEVVAMVSIDYSGI